MFVSPQCHYEELQARNRGAICPQTVPIHMLGLEIINEDLHALRLFVYFGKTTTSKPQIALMLAQSLENHLRSRAVSLNQMAIVCKQHQARPYFHQEIPYSNGKTL